MKTMKIGNFEITQEDLDMMIARLSAQNPQLSTNPEFPKQAEENLIAMTLFSAEGEDMGLEDTEEFRQSIAVARKDILSQLAVRKILDKVTITEDEKLAYYEKYKQYFVTDSFAEAKHILVETEEQALEIKSKIDNNELTFEDAAKEFSTCPSKENGGDLGRFRQGQMVPEFDKAVFEGENNVVIGPVKTQFGYHLILVSDKQKEEQESYEDCSADIEQMMGQEKQEKAYKDAIENLKKKYGVE